MPEESGQLARLTAALAERYRVERELGHGGMATVYLTEDLKHHRPVALKVLRPELAATLGPERFLREIEVTARLTHPHILPLLDSGDAGGFLYYAMPYVEGESLRDRLTREKQLPLDDALQIAREVADALSYAHSNDVVHRDIKPENILLQSGHAVVADFGIARAITAAGGERLTETGIAVGTPSYMSPEQAAGERDLDGRSDLYSLVCVLYEMLAGQPPFTGAVGESIVRQHLAADPPNLSNIRAGIPPHISAAIRRALAKAPADRYASTEAFVVALMSPPLVRGSALRRPTVPYAAAACAILAVGFMLYARHAGVEGALPRVSVKPFDNLTGDAPLNPIGQAVGQSIVDGLAELGTLEALPGDEVEGGSAFTVSGSFRLRGDSIEFVTQIIDNVRHRTLPAPEPVRSPLRDPLSRIEAVRNRASGALAYYTSVFGAPEVPERRPPSYPAYKAFSEGLRYTREMRPESSETAFRRATELDPTYTEAYLLLAGYALMVEPGPAARRGGQLGRPAAMDSVSAEMRAAINPLTDADQYVVQVLDARARGDLSAGMTAYTRLAKWIPSAVFGLAAHAVWLNRPKIAVDRLRQSARAQVLWVEFPQYWLVLSAAYHELGDYGEEYRTAQRALTYLPQFGPLVEVKLRAAIALGRVAEVEAALPHLAPPTALTLAIEARGHGEHREADLLLARVLHESDRAPQGQRSEPRYSRAVALSLLGRQSEAITVLRELCKQDTLRIDYRGMLGTAYARQGDRASAIRMSQELAAISTAQLQGLPVLWRARITAALGDKARAVELLQEAFAQGTWFFPLDGSFWHTDPAFQELRGYGPYMALTHPH